MVRSLAPQEEAPSTFDTTAAGRGMALVLPADSEAGAGQAGEGQGSASPASLIATPKEELDAAAMMCAALQCTPLVLPIARGAWFRVHILACCR